MILEQKYWKTNGFSKFGRENHWTNNGLRTLDVTNTMFFIDLEAKTLKNQWLCKPGARKQLKKQWFSIISIAGLKNICVFICFSVRKSGFLRTSGKSIVYIRNLIWKWMKNSLRIFPDLGKFRQSVRKIGKSLKNIVFFKFPFDQKWKTICFSRFRGSKHGETNGF